MEENDIPVQAVKLKLPVRAMPGGHMMGVMVSLLITIDFLERNYED